MVSLEDIKKDPVVDTFIRKGDEFLGTMGFTEHSYRHAYIVAKMATHVLRELNYPERDIELTGIAAFMHDIGNVVSRENHGQTAAVMAFSILSKHGMEPEEIAIVMGAIGNHEEQYGNPVHHVAAALILADKADVHRSRVRNQDFATFDIHDRVNYAAEKSSLTVDAKERTITMNLTIDIEICPVMEYFEIFLSRMVLCRRAADFLKCRFELVINGAKLL